MEGNKSKEKTVNNVLKNVEKKKMAEHIYRSMTKGQK